jgi:hypothetical protein
MINKKTLVYGITFAILLIIANGTMMAHAERITIEKPFEPVLIESGDIPRPTTYQRADPLEILCRLDADHKYHIFLVGEWVSNSSETDYDIEVFNSQNYLMSAHTEAAGLPEQVANDKDHQYFVPPKSDIYRFVIHNDSEYDEQDNSAVFMIIEHLDMNKRYELYLEGRPSPSQDYPDGHNWGYEFSTPAENFQLHIDVPGPDPENGITGLDMYEARIYPMANPSAQIGHNIWGVGVPSGDLLMGDVGSYGGYNTSIEGESVPELRASCEYAGEEMDVIFGAPQHNETELVLDTRDVFYYMVMLAEYYQGTISFYVKTDYRSVNITLVEAPDIAVTGEETRILVELESPAPLDAVWINYTTDGWKTEEKLRMDPYNDMYVGWLPEFELLDAVEYRVYAKDEIANEGMKRSSFIVLDPVNLHIETEKTKVYGGDTIEIRGEALPFSVVEVSITRGDYSSNTLINAAADGNWIHIFTPPNQGIYSAQVFFAGDDTHPVAQSRVVTFTMEKNNPLVSYILSPSTPKKNVEFEIRGATTPPVAGATVSFIIVSETTSYTQEAVTRNDGKFTIAFTPEELGNWQVLPQVVESDYIMGSSAELKEFQVIKLTILEKITIFLVQFTVMPLMLAPIGLVTGGFAFAEFKTGFFRGLISRSPKNGPATEEVEPEKEAAPKGATTYRRRSQR